MYINSTGFYIPKERVPNSYFLNINGLTDEWIRQRTGIQTRSKAAAGEGHNSMGLNAITDAIKKLPYAVEDVDLIVSAAYAPHDTVATLAHIAQRNFGMHKAKAIYASSACSSFVNGLEIIEGYFAMGKAEKALLVCSEHNTYYANETDKVCGHLWGDAAVAFFVSKNKESENDYTIKTIYTQGLGHIGKGPEGVRLRPHEDGIAMPEGRDVFIHACRYLVSSLEKVCQENGMTPSDLDYIICHQANKRIVDNVAHQLQMDGSHFLNNIEELGNTGSASCALVFAQNLEKFKKGQHVGLTVFGGGYSCGAFLVEI